MTDEQLATLSDIQTGLLNLINLKVGSREADVAFLRPMVDVLMLVTQAHQIGIKNKRILADLDGVTPALKPTDITVLSVAVR